MVAIAAVVGASACNLNTSGRVGATKHGDISRPAERGSPSAALREACGAEGKLLREASGVIKRTPYLQQVTTSSAIVGWRSPQHSGQHVEVTRPDGTLVARVPAVHERTVSRGDQMWAALAALEPDTTYCYTLASSRGPLTERIGFRTAPTADSERPIRFLAFGDSGGGGSDQHALLERMHELSYELIVHTGDLAYNSGKLSEFEANVFRPYAELLRHLPFFPAVGNHEYETMGAAPFRDVFALPGDGGERWYSYDWGRIHFAVLDTQVDLARQAEWLDRDLAATELPWKIVYLHKPPYSSGKHGSDLAVRRAIEPVLEKHGVQLVLAGHDHHYERTTPQRGVAHVVTGGGGKGIRRMRTAKSPFTAFADEVIHFVYVEVGVDELVVHAIDANGTEFDSLVVPRAPDSLASNAHDSHAELPPRKVN